MILEKEYVVREKKIVFSDGHRVTIHMWMRSGGPERLVAETVYRSPDGRVAVDVFLSVTRFVVQVVVDKRLDGERGRVRCRCEARMFGCRSLETVFSAAERMGGQSG